MVITYDLVVGPGEGEGDLGLLPRIHEEDFNPVLLGSFRSNYSDPYNTGYKNPLYPSTEEIRSGIAEGLFHDCVEHSEAAWYAAGGNPYLDELAAEGAHYFFRIEHDSSKDQEKAKQGMANDLINIAIDASHSNDYCYDEAFCVAAPFDQLEYSEEDYKTIKELYWPLTKRLITGVEKDDVELTKEGAKRKLRTCSEIRHRALDWIAWGYMNAKQTMAQQGLDTYYQLVNRANDIIITLEQSMAATLSDVFTYVDEVDPEMEFELQINFLEADAQLVWTNRTDWMEEWVGESNEE